MTFIGRIVSVGLRAGCQSAARECPLVGPGSSDLVSTAFALGVHVLNARVQFRLADHAK